MPTSPTRPARATKARKPARRKVRAKAAGTHAKAAGAHAKAAGKHAKAAGAKAAGRRRASARRASTRSVRPQTTLHRAQTGPRDLGDYAERAVLIPVGAALIARDRVVSTVSDALTSYSSPSRAQAQLRRFERRGTTARKRLEREVRKARVRVERELRQRRREIDRTVSDIDARRGAVAKNGSELANRVQERILSFV